MGTYGLVSGLEVEIEGYALRPLQKRVASGFERRTTVVELSGGGLHGLGEDVGYDAAEQERFQRAGPVLDLAGRHSLAELSERLPGLEPSGAPIEGDAHRCYRRWAFESAALDLALRQARRTLSEVLGRSPQPLRFVVSTGLGSPPSTARLGLLLARRAEARFKLDATPAWSDALVRELAALGRVDVLDFKGAYRGTPVDQPADPALYLRVLDALQSAILEDPHEDPRILDLLEGHWQRVAWDAPIHSTYDVVRREGRVGWINVKPSRLGSLSAFLDLHDHCAESGIPRYAGGQFELGPGRAQAQLLAALFHPDAPNDLAPLAYHDADPGPDAPASPLPVTESTPGFAAVETAPFSAHSRRPSA